MKLHDYYDLFIDNYSDKNVKKYTKHLIKRHHLDKSCKNKLFDKIKSLINYSNNIIYLNSFTYSTNDAKEIKEFERRVNKYIERLKENIEYEEMFSLDSDECYNKDVLEKIEKEKSNQSRHSNDYDTFIKDISSGEYSGLIGKSFI